MRDFFHTFLLFILLFVGCASGKDSGALKIAVITDIHYLDSQLVEEGEALTAYEQATGRNIADLHEVLNVVFTDLCNEKPDLLLITGDISNHGEKQSHLGMIEKLRILQNSGIRILVIPGNHDINIPNAKAYRGDVAISVETILKDEFATLYGSFGYSDALRYDTASLSYLAEVNDSLWLLCLDTNRYSEYTTSSITGGRILPETMNWATQILKEAKEKKIKVMGMMHHGLVEHMPYQNAFFPQYLIDQWQYNAEMLADAGLKVVFTGHFHANDITQYTSSSGNNIYDVETASLAQYPFAYRIMELEKDNLAIDTRFVTSVPGNRDLAKTYQQKLESLTRKVAEERINGLGLSMPNESRTALIDVIVKLNLLHVKGDEKLSQIMETAIRLFADQMGGEADLALFNFDFPPEDNRTVIPLR